jgi:hypothetical protein
MGVIKQLLGPGMEDGHHADGAADKPAITGQLDDGPGGGLEQRAVAVTLVCAQRRAQLLGHGDRDVKVGGREQLGLAWAFSPRA